MSQTKTLIDTLKRTLRAQQITYAMIADQIGLSEASIKRMFSRYSFSLERLEQICDMASLSVAELVRLADARPDPLTALTPDQEEELLADPRLLLVALMVLNDWTAEQICATFELDEHQLVRRLARLDRLGMIDLLPGNRLRKLVARNFTWRSNGPVQGFFEREVKKDFFKSRFLGQQDHLRFVGGRLGSESLSRMGMAIDRLTREFDDLVQADADLAHDQKVGVGAVFAIRPWELPTFRALRRS